MTLLKLFDRNRDQRILAVQKAGENGDEANLAGLKLLEKDERDERVRRSIAESFALIVLYQSSDGDTR